MSSPPSPPAPHAPRAVARWLFAVAGLIFVMVVLGGLTRLTESGLSITEWAPIMGALPPLSEADWLVLYEKYKQSPQFRKVFPDLTLAGFKGIFWLEYLHRLLGRVIGLAYAVPLAWFWLRGRIPSGLKPRLMYLLVLGGLQGLLGWYMVASGLVDRPSVSHYRLAAHLGLALILYVAVLWTALGLVQRRVVPAPALGGRFAAAAGLVAATVLYGAFVAGLDAGLVHNTFPLMGGRLIPDDLIAAEHGWRSVVEHRTAVQFVHRVLATAALLSALWLWLGARRGKRARAGLGVAAAAALQYALGIATLVALVPVWLGTLHQAGALVLITALTVYAHVARRA
jgi:cytochrome c oxidase assembly protein subunit 15